MVRGVAVRPMESFDGGTSLFAVYRVPTSGTQTPASWLLTPTFWLLNFKPMALRRVNAVVVGAGAGGGIVAKELAEAGLSVVLLERGKWYTAFDCRKDDLRNQRTSVLGCASARTTSAIAACSWTPGPRAGGAAERRRLRQQRRLRRRRHVQLRRAWRGVTWKKTSACAPPTARSAGSTLEDWPISYARSRAFYEKAEWEIGVSGDDSGQSFHGPAQASRCPCRRSRPAREHEILKPAAKRLGLHPFRHSHAAQHGALQRARRLHALPLVRGICLRGRRQERHAEHGDPQSAGHRQLRAAHRVRGEGDSDRRPRPGNRCRLLRRRRTSCRSSPRTWWWSPAAPRKRRACCSIPQSQPVSPRARQSLRLGGTESAGARLRGRLRVCSTMTSTTTSAPALPSPSAITTTATRAWSGGGDAVQ